ncbi:glutaminyl-peptide cyclotransferase [Maridesulfovibrio zosterae]|uniref:glutaminyl-peptide cyclotransferase n=1 Tax=Maridesulfovibrio zosterae TaxID=82171 RepID=UPI0004849E93|nr:glutaminyl-peptide cyclotransferase [Maridesulfovibrio zosterae]
MSKQYSIFFLIAITLILHLFIAKSYAGDSHIAPIVKCKILNHFPHDSKAFTQGLLFFNGMLYEGTGKRGHSAVRKVDPDSGQVRTEVKISNKLFGEGLCLWQNKIYQLTWQSGKCYVYDSKSLALKGVFKYKGQGWGLTTDGQFLYQSNGSSHITLRDPYDFARISRIQVMDGLNKIHRLNELEYIDGLLYCNIWREDRIAAVDVLTGKVQFWIDISNLRPLAGPEAEAANGIAFDPKNKRILVTGKFWNKVFEIKFPAVEHKNFTNQSYE